MHHQIKVTGFGHLFILVFKKSNAIVGMQVHGNGQISAFQIFEKLFVIRKQLPVKGITCPSLAPESVLCLCTLWHIFNQMPIHINGCYCQRNLFIRKLIHQVNIFLLSISIVSGPPVAKSILGQQGRKACELIKLL